MDNIYAKKAKPINTHDKLRIKFKELYGLNWNDKLNDDLPKKWKISADLLILPSNCFQLDDWFKLLNNSELLWKTLADLFKVTRIGKENRVNTDGFRTPNLTLLYGNDPVVVVNNNGIKYSYDITKCMFSWGNITEKLRIASFDCSNETVIDLFAGIGYFTLVYLIKAKAKQVIACEWNPASVESLKNNLKLNNCEDRCIVLEGDNKKTCPTNCADRINLGLIPSSEESWETATNALKLETGGYLHVHSNVDIKTKSLNENNNNNLKTDWIEHSNYAIDKIKLFLDKRSECVKWLVRLDHIEYVKSYGPRVDHIVLDICCRPI